MILPKDVQKQTLKLLTEVVELDKAIEDYSDAFLSLDKPRYRRAANKIRRHMGEISAFEYKFDWLESD